MKKDDCIFCKIAAGEIPSTTLYEDDKFRAFFDVSPASKGHALLVPKDHYDNLFELDEEVAGELFKKASKIARALKEATGCEGMNLVQNNGTVAGQTVYHFHLHFIPRNEGDGVDLHWKQQEADMEYLAELAKKVSENI